MKGNQSMVDILTSLTAATTGYLDGVTVHLCADNFTPNANSTPADLAEHEANYTGYAASAALVWLDPYILPTGDAVIPASDVQFQPSGSTVANVIYSYWVQKGTGGSAKLIEWHELPAPVPLGSVFDSLLVHVDYVIPQD